MKCFTSMYGRQSSRSGIRKTFRSLKDVLMDYWIRKSLQEPIYFHLTHPQPEGFYPDTWCLFLPKRRNGMFVVGTTFWPNGAIWSEDFWVFPGHDEWRLATEKEFWQVVQQENEERNMV